MRLATQCSFGSAADDIDARHHPGELVEALPK